MVKYKLDPTKAETIRKLIELKELIEKDEESQNKNYYDVFQYEVKTEYEGKEYTFTRIIAVLLYSPSE